MVASHTIDKQALHDNQAVLRKLFDFSAVFPKVVLQTGIQKYDRRIGVCIECAKTRVHLETHADGSHVFLGAFFFPNLLLFGLSVIAGRSGSNMKSGTASWPMIGRSAIFADSEGQV